MTNKIKVYTPRVDQSFYKLFVEILRGFYEGHELAWRLFVRDLQAGYRKSMLGFLWLFLPPMATAGVWIFLNSQRVVAVQDPPMKYAAFALCGTMLWSLFAESIAKPITRYQSAMPMMSKLNFPREAIILACIFDLAFGFFIRLVILMPLLWIFGYPPTWFFIPAFASAFGLAICGLSIGIFLSPLGLLYSDVGKGLPVILPFAMYLTPVIYPMRVTGALASIQWINPVTPFLEAARSQFGDYGFSMHLELLVWTGAIVVMMFVGLITLKIALPVIVERAGS